MALANWMSDVHNSSGVERRSVEVDGHRMYYWKAGSGPALILLHGLLGTAEVWEDLAPELGAESTVYAVDALGIGESERVPGIDPGLEAQAYRMDRFMDAIGIRSADVLGTSHGGAVALMLAAKYPQRVRSLILHAPANPFSSLADPPVHFYQSHLGRWFARHIPGFPEELQAIALGRMYGNCIEARPEELHRYTDSLRVPGTIDYLLSVLNGWFHDMESLKSVLGKVRGFPTLLLWGEHDRTVSLESGRVLEHCFDRVKLVVLPDAGHVSYEECPEIFAQAVLPFLRQQRAEHNAGLHLVRKSSPENLGQLEPPDRPAQTVLGD